MAGGGGSLYITENEINLYGFNGELSSTFFGNFILLSYNNMHVLLFTLYFASHSFCPLKMIRLNLYFISCKPHTFETSLKQFSQFGGAKNNMKNCHNSKF